MIICNQCQSSFKIRDEDRHFYQKVSPVIAGKKYLIPDPTLCPACRQQRRLSWRNESVLYKRKCDATGKIIFSIYPENTPFPVYSPEAWFGDEFDATEYGREFDFKRPFFEQFYELQNTVPRIANILSNTINCDYCNIVGDSKNCYLLYGSVHCEDCLYGNPYYSKNCVDSLFLQNSHYCYECVDSDDLYECQYSQNCSHSQYLSFCFDVEGSEHCFLCVGLRKKKYHILNQAYSKQEYHKKVDEYRKRSPQELLKMLKELKEKSVVKAVTGTGNENVSGDLIFQSKNCHSLFQGEKCEEVSFSSQVVDSHHCMDGDCGEVSHYLYEVSGFYKTSNLLFSHWCWEAANLLYCSTNTANTRDCFGCISLKHKQYCILNKQYTKEEYEKLLPKIIEHMQSTEEWGEFFPTRFSPFAYNETIAQDYFPLTQEEILGQNWRWADEKIDLGKVEKTIPANLLPSNIQDVPDDILNWAIECEVSKKPFKITPPELKFYRQFHLSIPHLHPAERHKRRIEMRNPRVLFERNCDQCGMTVKTSYSPERPEKVNCEKCYLKHVY